MNSVPVSLDTGVIAEYIDLAGRFHREADAVMGRILAGKLTALVPHEVLAETFYVSCRIYQRLGLTGATERARRLVEWIYASPNITLAEPSLDLALLAGEVKQRFGLALTDSYVLAGARINNGRALFRTKEREMAARFTELTREYEVVFLG
ncbi:MAG: PIN domain-containing protein [Nitrososphaerota archaeon]|nr:PIN domain-containing protein [Nitrososphaerota archaeon]